MSPRLRTVAVAIGVVALAIAALPLIGGGRTSTSPGVAVAGVEVLVLDRPVAAGGALDPSNVRVVRVSPAVAPGDALRHVEDAAFRQAAVALPARLPLVPSLLRRPGAGSFTLARGERAIGVRVDDVTGIPALLGPGARVDVVLSTRGPHGVGTVTAAENVEVVARPRQTADAWAVVVRVPVNVAAAIAAAQADAREVRLLLRQPGAGP